jgi:hypothetical protein
MIMAEGVGFEPTEPATHGTLRFSRPLPSSTRPTLHIHIVGGEGVEPPESETCDLQSHPLPFTDYPPLWCQQRGSNPHELGSLDFKSSAYTYLPPCWHEPALAG